MTQKPEKLFCPDCDDLLDADDFSNNKSTLTGKSFYCKLHAAERQREWKHAHKEKVKAWKRDYRKRVREDKRNGST